jgi:glycosyltransferase involved in cell wall biosynthesis
MAEAMGAGVPVIAYDRGSCREVVADGETGFLVMNVNEAVKAVNKIETIDPAACRKRVEEKFSIPTMVKAYETVYAEIFKLEKEKTHVRY